MQTLQECHYEANDRFAEADLADTPLADLNMPELQLAPNGERTPVPYDLVGNPTAPYMLLESTPHFTRLKSPHYRLRLRAHQAALGSDYCVVGVQTYEPGVQEMDRDERKQAANGSYHPATRQMLRVAEALSAKRLLLHGFSKPADEATQLVYSALTDPNAGIVEVHGLSVHEAARTAKRGPLGVTKALADSSQRLQANVLASSSRALNEAWGLDPANLPPPKSAVRQMWRDLNGLRPYVCADVRGNWAVARASGTDETVRQLDVILGRTTIPVVVGRQALSTVFDKPGFDKLVFGHAARAKFYDVIEQDNDHMADDNIRRSAGRVLYFATRLTA